MNVNVKSQTTDLNKFRPRSLSPMIGFTSRTPISEVKNSAESTQNAYILPKFTNVELNPPVSSNDSKISEETKSNLYQKIALLEKLHRSDLLRIEQLERQVKDLLEQLTSMKNMNKSLLEEKKGFGSGEVHALYQDLFITDMKQQMTDLNNDVSKFRSQKEMMKKEFENIKKENGQLNATVKRYRIMLSNALKKPHGTLESMADTSSVFSGFASEIDKTPRKTSENLRKRMSVENSLGPPLHSLRVNSISVNKMEKINLILIQLTNCLNMNQLCKILTRSAKALTKSEKVSVYIISSKAREHYIGSYSGSADFIGKVRLGNEWIIMHTHKDAYQEEPMFKKLDELKFPIRHADLLVMPITYDREISLAIQCQEKVRTNIKSRIFNPTDELLLKLVANVSTLKIESLYAMEQEKLEFKHSGQIATVAGKIVSSLTHREIANKIRKVLPGYFDFENAGIVFLDGTSHQFFVMIHDPTSDDYFGDGVLKFPFGIGLTGQAISREGVSVFHNPKSLQHYNPEIDNVGWLQETRCIMMGCLKDWNANIVGIIQFTNKKYGDVNTKDVKRLESLLEMLGACIAATNLAVEHFGLTIKFKETMEKILKLVAENEKNNNDAEFNSIVNRIKHLKTSFSDWADNRKVGKMI